MRNNFNMQHVALFQNLAVSCLKKMTIFFSWFREFAPPNGKKTSFFAKMGASMVYALIGSVGGACRGGGGGGGGGGANGKISPLTNYFSSAYIYQSVNISCDSYTLHDIRLQSGDMM